MRANSFVQAPASLEQNGRTGCFAKRDNKLRFGSATSLNGFEIIITR
jgi:hypothetical protein